jgi:nucleoside-diphosphate-sugar epimerase
MEGAFHLKAVVTGGSGFTGSHLVRRLLKEGHEVRMLVRDSSKLEALGIAGVEVVQGDLRDPDAVKRLVDGAEWVFHVGAVYREAGVPDARYAEVNVDGTRHVLDAAASAGVTRVVHVSTVGVHGHIEHPPADETAPYAPGDTYQASKVEGERMALRFAREGLPVVIARPAAIYGPGDTRLLKLFRLIARRRFVMLGDGESFYHLVYIDDLIDGFLLCARAPGVEGRTYILAGEEYVTKNKLAGLVAGEMGVPTPRRHLPVGPFQALGSAVETVCRPLGIKPPIYRRRVDFFVKSRAFDISKARRELGYTPQVGLKDGLRRTAEWYREAGWI